MADSERMSEEVRRLQYFRPNRPGLFASGGDYLGSKAVPVEQARRYALQFSIPEENSEGRQFQGLRKSAPSTAGGDVREELSTRARRDRPAHRRLRLPRRVLLSTDILIQLSSSRGRPLPQRKDGTVDAMRTIGSGSPSFD